MILGIDKYSFKKWKNEKTKQNKTKQKNPKNKIKRQKKKPKLFLKMTHIKRYNNKYGREKRSIRKGTFNLCWFVGWLFLRHLKLCWVI